MITIYGNKYILNDIYKRINIINNYQWQEKIN